MSGFSAFLIPPVQMLIIQQTLLLGIGMSAGDTRERFRGSILPLHRAYKNPFHIAVGKMLFGFLFYLLLGIYMFTFVTCSFSLPPSASWRLLHFPCLPHPVPRGLYLLFHGLLCIGLSAGGLHIALRVHVSATALPSRYIVAWSSHASVLESGAMDSALHIRPQRLCAYTGHGASLSDVAFQCHCLWNQTMVYFSIAVLLYHRQIRFFIRKNARRIKWQDELGRVKSQALKL